MRCEKTPFKPGWYAAGSKPWGCRSTYCLIPYEKLPKLDFNLFKGKFQWLCEIKTGIPDFYKKGDVDKLLKNAKKQNIKLPESFITFITDQKLQKRIPSCTACYYELSKEFIEVSGHKKYKLIRFLNDQQSVLLWYICVDSTGDNCVVVAPYYYEEDIRKELYEEISINDVLENTYFCASTFEEFIYRFWIENTLWFSLTDNLPLSPIEKDYLNAIEKITKKYNKNTL